MSPVRFKNVYLSLATKLIMMFIIKFLSFIALVIVVAGAFKMVENLKMAASHKLLYAADIDFDRPARWLLLWLIYGFVASGQDASGKVFKIYANDPVPDANQANWITGFYFRVGQLPYHSISLRW